MALIDIVLSMLLMGFMVSGYRAGFVKKIIGIVCLVLALVLATKFSADISELLFELTGISGRTGFILSFIVIVVSITLVQSVLYRVLIKDMVDAIWNKILGLVVGVIEGGLIISIGLIVLSIYLHLPGEETKANSELYKPLKNFSPMVFDQVNTFLPESEDFYQQILKFATEEMNKLEKK
ncbi:MAG: CvpA family protein [Bacteroidota bacterium]|nr:CvpA family protein [Bacteroidota bacterium]